MDLSGLNLSFGALDILDRWKKYKRPIVNESAENSANNEKIEKTVPIISLDEVAWHDTIDDCWLVICDYVYDCTDFLRSHPGGQDILVEYAGRDATLAFIGYGHSKGAKRILEKYLIGELPLSERIFRTENGIKIGDID